MMQEYSLFEKCRSNEIIDLISKVRACILQGRNPQTPRISQDVLGQKILSVCDTVLSVTFVEECSNF